MISGYHVSMSLLCGYSSLFFVWYSFDIFYCCCLDQIMSETFAIPWTITQPDSSVHGIFQARILEWVAISFSRGSSQSRDGTQFSSHLLHRQASSLLLSLQGGPLIHVVNELTRHKTMASWCFLSITQKTPRLTSQECWEKLGYI